LAVNVGIYGLLGSLTWALISGAIVALLIRSIRSGPARFLGWKSVTSLTLQAFAIIWLTGFVLLNLAMSVRVFRVAPDVWEGIATWQRMYEPSFGTMIIMALLIAPGVGAWNLADRISGSQK
jgi:hypothetical protein